MARKHFEMNSDVRKLIDKYSENHDVEFSDLINKALKFYLVNQMNHKEVKELYGTQTMKCLSTLMKPCAPVWVILTEDIN